MQSSAARSAQALQALKTDVREAQRAVAEFDDLRFPENVQRLSLSSQKAWLTFSLEYSLSRGGLQAPIPYRTVRALEGTLAEGQRILQRETRKFSDEHLRTGKEFPAGDWKRLAMKCVAMTARYGYFKLLLRGRTGELRRRLDERLAYLR